MSKKTSTDTQLNQQACPLARKDDLLTTQVGDETVVYDQLTDKASCLNTLTATVWAACDGKNTLSDLLSVLRLAGFQDASDDIVRLTVNELGEAELLQELPQGQIGNTHKQSRRDMLRSIGRSAAIAIPIISTISIQPSIAGVSCQNVTEPCTGGLTCCPGLTCNGVVCV